MMWGSDYPHSESTFPQSRKILADILAGVPADEQAKIAGDNSARVYRFDDLARGWAKADRPRHRFGADGVRAVRRSALEGLP
jgi:hypothetical protein